MGKTKLPALEVAILGAALVVIAFIWQNYNPRDWTVKAALYNLLVISGWGLIVIGWIGRVANVIIEYIEEIRARVIQLSLREPEDYSR